MVLCLSIPYAYVSVYKMHCMSSVSTSIPSNMTQNTVGVTHITNTEHQK